MKISENVKVNEGFKSSINLYLNLNDTEKINGYIPTSASVELLGNYLRDVIFNKNQATLLIGPYGKGKSHLLLILLSLISMDRDCEENKKAIKGLIEKVNLVDKEVGVLIGQAWQRKRIMPVLINGSESNLNQAFLLALSTALKRDGIDDIVPDTYFSHAVAAIENWKCNYPQTYGAFIKKLGELDDEHKDLDEFMAGLVACDFDVLNIFRRLYPELTAGSQFAPMINSEVLPLYKSVNDQLCDSHDYEGIYIVFDEFSKFIESRKEDAASDEMKLLQDMCELAAERSNSKLFITMVAHKSVKEYGKYLSREFINSFTGIEGRIEERHFLSSPRNNYELIKNAIIKKKNIKDIVKDIYKPEYVEECYESTAFRNLFDKQDYYETVVLGAYPLVPIATYMLLNISEKVAQNERTLFTFLSKNEKHSMAKFIADGGEGLIYAPLIYDYFNDQFKKDISNVYIHNEWLKANYAIQTAQSDDEKKIIKTIGLINIINRPDELFPNETVIRLASGVANAGEILDSLRKREIVRLKKETGAYLFKTKIAINLDSEITKRKKLKKQILELNKTLLQTSKLDFILPKEYNQKSYMTRYYRYVFMDSEAFMAVKNSDSFINKEEFCDGKVILLISKSGDVDEVRLMEHINRLSDGRIVVVSPSRAFKIDDKINEYEILQVLKKDENFIDNNKALIAEIELYEEELTESIKAEVDEIYFKKLQCFAYDIDSGNCKKFTGISINRIVSLLCRQVYSATPVINNEMINKQFVNTAPIKRARKQIVDKILATRIIGEKPNGTAAEDTICRAAFYNSISSTDRKVKFERVIDEIRGFINSCVEQKICISELIDTLQTPPYGVRTGVIPMLLAFTFKDRIDDIVVYFGKREIQLTGDIIINMVNKPSDYQIFVSKANAEKDGYISFLYKLFQVDENYNLSGSKINDILISMKRWFRALPQVTRSATLSNTKMKTCKDSKRVNTKLKKILQNVDSNAYESLLNDIPQAFGNKNLEETGKGLYEYKEILDSYFDVLTSDVIERVKDLFGHKDKSVSHVLKNWYDAQSSAAKDELHSAEITSFMSYIGNLTEYDDEIITKKIAKIVTGAYMENWNEETISSFIDNLKAIKQHIESIKDSADNGDKNELIFTNSQGETVRKIYTAPSESGAGILKNILEDTLEDFYDMSANDKTAVLLELIEKIID